jgi:hypothetical protein
VRRYLRFTIFALLVSCAFAAGVVLQGGAGLPQPAELAGLDPFTAWIFKAGAYAKVLAGVPWFLARLFDGGSSFLGGRPHEYGTTLLTMAGVLNVLAVSGALDLRWEKTH